MKKNRNGKTKVPKQKKLRKKRFNWKNVKIGKKYLSVYIFTAILFFTAGAIANIQLNEVQQDIAVIEEQSQRVNDMVAMTAVIQAKDVQVADYLLTGNPAFIDTFNEYSNEFNDLAEKLEPTINSEREKTIFEQITANSKIIDEAFTDRMIPSMEKGQEEAASSLRNYSSMIRTQTIEEIDKLKEMVVSEQGDSVDKAENSMNRSINVLNVANVVTVIIGIILLILISKRITANLQNVVRMTKEMANGNLKTVSLDYNGKDEVGQLYAAVNQMKENIRHILLKVTDASGSVNQRSEELTQAANEVKEGNIQIATTMEELASGTETQANSASDLSESMSNFVENVRFSDKSGQEVSVK